MGKLVATFSDAQQAEQAMSELHRQGFEDKEISLITKDHRKESERGQGGHHDTVTDGTGWGAGIGAGAGLLASAGLLAIPGIGPILALGPLAATLSGAAVGGLTGAFVDWGMPAKEGEHLQKEVQEGRAVILVDAPDSRKAEDILRKDAQELKIIS